MLCIALSLIAIVSAQADLVAMERDASSSPLWKPSNTLVKNHTIELTFALKLRNTDELSDTLLRVSTPSSKDYGKLFTYDQVHELTDPFPETAVTVKKFLEEFAVSDMKVSHGFVGATVSVELAEKILSAQYGAFIHPETGETAIRCPGGYHLPDDIASLVDFVAPTVNFPRPLHVKSKYSGKEGEKSSSSLGASTNTPDSLRELYGLGDAMGGKAKGTSQAVTAFLHQYYTEEDLQSFYEQYFPELLGTPISKVVGPNGDTAGIEASLDVEYMTVLGAGVPTEFWSYAGRQPNNTQNEPFLSWLVDLDDTETPPLVFSTSYGEDESSVSFDYATRMNQEFQKNSLRGITFLFASGDSGVGSAFGPCTTFTPQYPSDSPYVTAVGATTGTGPETAAGLSSGGFSNRWARPSWQNDAVAAYFSTASDSLPDADLYNATGRGFPDVSAQGTGFTVINNGQTYPAVAGTSCSSPTFGGIVGMLNDARIAAGKSPMGFLNPFIYANPAVFTDVTAGNNPGCGTTGFEATAGWDPVTGYGTPNYPAMLEAALALP